MSNLNSFKTIISQIFVPKKILFCIYVLIPFGLFYIAAILSLKFVGFELMEILRDPAQQSGESSFIGFISNIGIWMWVSTTAICFFSLTANRGRVPENHKSLLFLIGMLTLFLATDDLLLIHDRYINEYICYGAYATIAIAIVVRYYKEIIKIDGFAFLLAGLFLGLSIFTDIIQLKIPLEYSYTQVFEEGFKFMGGATLLYFSTRLASYQLPQQQAGY